MSKKMISAVIILLSVILLSSPALSEGEWDRDAHEHWQTNEAGDRINAGTHRAEDGFCEICQSEIWLFEDGSCDINNYSSEGDLIRYSYYEADGTLESDYVYVFQYDENGNKAFSFTYLFGIMIEETEYRLDPVGESIVSKVTSYSDDGTVSVNIADQFGNIVSGTITDENGNVLFEQNFTYTYDSDGFPTYMVENSRFDDGTSFRMESDALGNRIFEAQYAPDGSVIYEYHFAYEYDEHGRMIHDTVLENGAPVFESFYAYSSDPYDFWGYQCRTIDHMEDGSTIVCDLNEMGEIIKETSYDANGNIIS